MKQSGDAKSFCMIRISINYSFASVRREPLQCLGLVIGATFSVFTAHPKHRYVSQPFKTRNLIIMMLIMTKEKEDNEHNEETSASHCSLVYLSIYSGILDKYVCVQIRSTATEKEMRRKFLETEKKTRRLPFREEVDKHNWTL